MATNPQVKNLEYYAKKIDNNLNKVKEKINNVKSTFRNNLQTTPTFIAILLLIVCYCIGVVTIKKNDKKHYLGAHYQLFLYWSIILLFLTILLLFKFGGFFQDKREKIIKPFFITLALIIILRSKILDFPWYNVLLILIFIYFAFEFLESLYNQYSISKYRAIAPYYLKREASNMKKIKKSNIIFLGILIIIFTLLYFTKFFTNTINYLLLPKHTTLIKSPQYLDKLVQFKNFQQVKNPTANYGMSFWIFITPEAPSTKWGINEFVPLINYGNKPNIYYKGSTNELQISMLRGKKNLVKTYYNKDFQLQKWNHFVINFQDNNLDIFLNSKLVGGQYNILPYLKKDRLIIGNDVGVQGGIRDVFYYKNPLKLWQIQFLYYYQK